MGMRWAFAKLEDECRQKEQEGPTPSAGKGLACPENMKDARDRGCMSNREERT